MIRVLLPQHLRTLSGASGEVLLEVAGAATIDGILGALEERYPQLRGTVRDHDTLKRRAFIRFFAGGEDLSNDATDVALPEAVTAGREPFYIVGAIAGG